MIKRASIWMWSEIIGEKDTYKKAIDWVDTAQIEVEQIKKLAVENDILLVVQNINGSIALIVSIIVLSVMVAQYDVLALVVLIIMVIVQNVFTKRGTSEGVELNKSLEMFKIKEA